MGRLIALTGGIGSGKSMVAEMLRVMGHAVYDCDSRARELMDTFPHIARRIAAEIDARCVGSAGRIDRSRLSAIVFGDAEALRRLNSIVHTSVLDDLQAWAARQPDVAFVETAIPYSSGIWRIVDAIWEVQAPESLRLERVMARSGLSPEQTRSRIESQARTEIAPAGTPAVSVIINDGVQAVLPQLLALLASVEE